MGLDARGRLDLRRDERLIVRLVTVGVPRSWRGKPIRLLGELRGYHFVRRLGRSFSCTWLPCKFCDRGWKPDIKFEVPLIWEAPDGSLQNVIALLSQRENRLFGVQAQAIELEQRDPRDVRLLWKWSADAPGHVEVLRL